MSRQNKSKEEPRHPVFERLRELTLEAPSHLESRVLAIARERRNLEYRVRFWRGVGIGAAFSGVTAIVLFLAVRGLDLMPGAPPQGSQLMMAQVRPVEFSFVLSPGGGEFESVQKQPVTLRLARLDQTAIANAEIELSSGIEFYSVKFPDLKFQRAVTVKFDAGNDYIPVVVRSNEPGTKFVKVRFLDSQQKTLVEKSFEIKFNSK